MHRELVCRLLISSLLAWITVTGAGCSSSGTRYAGTGTDAAGDVADAVLAQFPTPDEILRLPAATEAERTKLGSEYLDDAGLFNRVTRNMTHNTVTFYPEYKAAEYPPLSSAAYCVYRFRLPDYNDTAEVVYYFSEPPATWDTAYIGLGDLTRGTWRWHKCVSYGKFSLDSIAPYISDPAEELVLAVVVIGTEVLVLDYLRIGDNSEPIASFTAEPSTGPAPLSVHFDASMSYDYMGSITNYEWDAEGDGTFETTGPSMVTTDFIYNTAGTYNATLRVTDPYGLTDTATVPVNVTQEPSGTWHLTLADDGYEETGWYPTLLEVQGLPAVAYLDHKNYSTNGAVRYVRATDAQGTTWGTPIVIGECGEGGGHVSAAFIGGKPAVVYGDAVNRQFVICTATDANGDTWGAPVKIADDTGEWPGFTALAVVAGNPAVAFADTGRHVHYIRALDTAGVTWPATDVTVDTSTSAVDGAQLLVSGGVPLLFYNCDMWREVRLARAQDAQGTAWDAPVVLLTTEMGTFSHAALVEGLPALAYVNGGNLDLYFMRASDAAGTTWDTAVKVSTVSSTGRRDPWLAVIAGKPAVTYYDQDNGKLLYVRAQDAAGAAWGEPMVVDNDDFDTTGWYSSLNLVAGMPAVAYYNFTKGALMFAAMY